MCVGGRLSDHGDLAGWAQVRAAITSGEDVDGVDIGRSTALHWAARKGHLGVATVLVSKGASLMKKTKLGKTAIDLAREEGNNEVSLPLTLSCPMSQCGNAPHL